MRFWEVERAVEAWYRRLGILAPPVDLDRLCDDCDVVVVRAPYPHLALPESGVILLDSSETDALRQRWRHAHELAHILRDVGGQMYAQSSWISYTESEAETVAGILLAPAHLIRAEVESGFAPDVLNAFRHHGSDHDGG
ncbi:MAG: ImmA/IrrE family metallo-endopeptidase [Alicyclobacillus sp.]|nr:ImmA/IrrE family metallo-endopeptidase [Alicyclobacillus sp.]